MVGQTQGKENIASNAITCGYINYGGGIGMGDFLVIYPGWLP